ncbi:MAG: EAL domain-containing protein [Oscillospiraceae bacterium]|nr:EAL domain-containing protein [Oscillospiraceae bacterium]
MPIHAQCCGLFIMLVLLYFYKSQKSIKLNTERSFWNAFCMTIVCIVLDITSCVTICRMDFFPMPLVRFVAKAYLVSLVGVTFFALMYICTDIYSVKEMYIKRLRRYLAFALTAAVLIFVVPIELFYDKDEGQLYSYGPSTVVAYIFAALTMIMMGTLLVRKRKEITKSRLEAVAMLLGIWLVAVVTQFIFPKLLLVGFACAAGMLVLYLKMENPGYNIDRQTGLFNNSAFLQYSKQLYDMKSSFSVLAIVIERSCFRSISSELEDAVIAEAVQYLLSIPDTRVFRITSTEIMLIFSDKDTARENMESVRRRFGQPWGKSRGVIVSPYWIYAEDSLLADNTIDLLYLIRYARQNSKELAETRFFEIENEFVRIRREEKDIEGLIADALKNDWVEVWYQPIYSTEEGRFTSAEALIRIRTNTGKLYQPGNFIDIAERNGTIMQLGETVFEKVCRFLKEYDINAMGLDYIEVNLSVIQCAYSQLAEDYIRIMEEYEVEPGLINLEITESASINARKTLLRNMESLRKYGVTFSLDDFGTGQSNLDYIVDMPVQIVKFDKGMTGAYFENGKAKYIMDAAMGMIQGMNLKIVSEGIESESQFNVMRELGINYIQGYYFSKPLPADEFVKFIRENQCTDRGKKQEARSKRA